MGKHIHTLTEKPMDSKQIKKSKECIFHYSQIDQLWTQRKYTYGIFLFGLFIS